MDRERGRRVRLRLLIGLAAVAVSGAAAGQAEAFSAFTGDVTPGLNTATVYGYIDTSNVQTEWAFAYGASTKYASWTSFGTIAAGQGTVMVAAVLTGLQPGTAYHYRLIAVPASSRGEYSDFATGQDQWFHTERPQLELLSSRLVFRRASSQIPLECVNLHPCRGVLSLALVRAPKGRDPSCAKVSLAIPAGAARAVGVRLAKACIAQLKAARSHQLGGLLSARPDGRLPALRSAVTIEAG